MTEELDKLRELTANLPPIPKMADLKIEVAQHTEYKIKNGTCISRDLYSDNDVSVARLLITSGGELPEHKHKEKEYAVIASGKIVIYKEGKRMILGVGDCIVFEVNVLHRARALEDTWLIGVSIPCSKDFPESKKL